MDMILAVDLGTTAVKTSLFDQHGALLVKATREYQLSTPTATAVELDVEVYWRAFRETVTEILAERPDAPGHIRALGISAQGETLVCVDEAGAALRPAIVWLDNRAQEEADRLAAHFGNETCYRVTGQVSFVPTWPAAKILWLREHEPDLFRRTRWFMLIEDWLVKRLTGVAACEGSLVTSTAYWDFTKRAWWPEMLDYLGIDDGRLPELRESGAPVGPIIPAIARELGLDPSTTVVMGALDQAAGAIGVGNIRPGVFSENTGAALAICATVPVPTFDPAAQMPCHYHGVPGLYMEHTFTSGGMVLRWYRDAFCQPELESARTTGRDPYDLLGEMAAGVAPGCEGLVMMPHLQGAMAPEANPRARGVFYGFTLRHGKAHFARAIMESIGCIVRRNLEVVESIGIPVSEIRVLGGGARSPLWNQIKADITGRPVVTTENEEAACLGAAILAGSGVGVFGSIEQAVSEMVVTKQRFEPIAENRAVYEGVYREYVELYGNLVGMFDRYGDRA
jgi:sugar (pentulose or hexulose) kinase